MAEPGNAAILEQLRTVPVLDGASGALLDWLAKHVRHAEFAAGEALIVEGDTGRDCLLLTGGSVEVSARGNVVGRSGPGWPEGEVAMLFDRPRAGTVTALEPVTALIIAAEDFDALRKSDPDLSRELAGKLVYDLRSRFS